MVAHRSTVQSHPALLIRFTLSTHALYKFFIVLYSIEIVVWQDTKAESLAASSSANAVSASSTAATSSTRLTTNSAVKSATSTVSKQPTTRASSATHSVDALTDGDPAAAVPAAAARPQPSLQTVDDISQGYRLCSWLCLIVLFVTQRRSVAKNVGCFQRRLFVCGFVGLWVCLWFFVST